MSDSADNKWKNFGKNLGFTNVAYIKKYGHNWQFYLAKDIVRDIHVHENWGIKNRDAALEYLRNAPSVIARSPRKGDGHDDHGTYTTFYHYSDRPRGYAHDVNEAKKLAGMRHEMELYDDTYWHKMKHLNGGHKVLPAELKAKYDALMKASKQTRNREEKWRLRREAEKIKTEGSIEKWKLAYATDKRVTGENRAAVKQSLEKSEKMNAKLDKILDTHVMIDAGIEVNKWLDKVEANIHAGVDNRDLGFAIGKGENLDYYDSLYRALLEGMKPHAKLKQALKNSHKFHTYLKQKGAKDLYKEYNVPYTKYEKSPNKYYRKTVKKGAPHDRLDPRKKAMEISKISSKMPSK